MKRRMFYINLWFILLILTSCSETTKQVEEFNGSEFTEFLPDQTYAVEPEKQTKSNIELPETSFYEMSENEESVTPDVTQEQNNSEVLAEVLSNQTDAVGIEPPDLKRYEVQHAMDHTKYWVSITSGDYNRFMLTLFNHELVELQTIHIRHSEITDVELMDLNSDGYTDIILGSNAEDEIQKAYQEAYLWDISSQSYVKVDFRSFSWLEDFEIEDGYIRNFVDSKEDPSCIQILVFYDNILMKTEEYHVVQHEEDDEKYWVSIVEEDNGSNTLTLFDYEFRVLQVIPDNELPYVPNVDLMDLNSDGYTDIIIELYGTWNVSHGVYLWDTSLQGYTKVVFEGFDMLAEIEVKEGYIYNFIRGSSPEDSSKEKLVFDGNVLKKAEE